jgi:hypothetical protein
MPLTSARPLLLGGSDGEFFRDGRRSATAGGVDIWSRPQRQPNGPTRRCQLRASGAVGDTLAAVLPREVSSPPSSWSTSNTMKLEKCPYDRSPVVVHTTTDGYVIACDTCGAVWEMHGTRIHRLRAPDASIVRRVRNGLFSPEAVGDDVISGTESVDNAVH